MASEPVVNAGLDVDMLLPEHDKVEVSQTSGCDGEAGGGESEPPAPTTAAAAALPASASASAGGFSVRGRVVAASVVVPLFSELNPFSARGSEVVHDVCK